MLRQVSPESESIFELIIKLSKACDGDWKLFVEQSMIETQDLDHFLDYAAAFLDSVGNYRVCAAYSSNIERGFSNIARDMATQKYFRVFTL